MRISDEERREIARRLRTDHRQDRENQGTFIARMVKGGGRVTALDVYNLPERLADLIDRPTCKNLATKPADELLCSECGEHVDIAYMESADDYHAKHCPNCGAEVVPDGC